MSENKYSKMLVYVCVYLQRFSSSFGPNFPVNTNRTDRTHLIKATYQFQYIIGDFFQSGCVNS